MSSSLGSISFPHFFQYQFAECRIDFGIDPQHPVLFDGEWTAFYRILLGHYDEIGSGESEVAGAECMVVGKRMRGERESQALQKFEKALRVADAGNRVQAAVQKLLH